MFTPFSKTALDAGEDYVRLLDQAGAVLLELRGEALERAILLGFVDSEMSHHSVYGYARMLRELGPSVSASPRGGSADYDRRFLGELGLRWD